MLRRRRALVLFSLFWILVLFTLNAYLGKLRGIKENNNRAMEDVVHKRDPIEEDVMDNFEDVLETKARDESYVENDDEYIEVDDRAEYVKSVSCYSKFRLIVRRWYSLQQLNTLNTQ